RQYLFSAFGCSILLCLSHRNCDRNTENERYDSKREGARERKIIHENHLDADETEHESQAGSQVNETVHQTGEQEVKGSQAENRANIRRINNKRIARDREDRRD